MKPIVFAASLAAACTVSAAEPAATALVTVDVGMEIGVVKPMNAVNNGPSVKKPRHDQVRGNFEAYKAAAAALISVSAARAVEVVRTSRW